MPEPLDLTARVNTEDGAEWARIGPWWVTPALDEVPRCWDYLADREPCVEATP